MLWIPECSTIGPKNAPVASAFAFSLSRLINYNGDTGVPLAPESCTKSDEVQTIDV